MNHDSFFYFLKYNFKFIFGSAGSVVQASHCGLLLLRSTGSRLADFNSCNSQALEHRLEGCGSWT